MRFEPNLSLLFQEVPFYERFARAREAGFSHVEFLTCALALDADTLTQAIADAGLRLVQFNFLNGDMSAGERGFLSHPDERTRWREGFRQALDLAERLGAEQIHSLAGVALPGLTRAEQIAVLVENLRWAAPYLERAGRPMMLEALNEGDNPGYLLQAADEMVDVLRRVGSPWIRLQFDCYHIYRTMVLASCHTTAAAYAGAVVQHLEESRHYLGHIQVADFPGRNEPGTGQIDYCTILGALERTGYDRFIGLEFRPRVDTAAALAWLPRPARSRACTLTELDF